MISRLAGALQRTVRRPSPAEPLNPYRTYYLYTVWSLIAVLAAAPVLMWFFTNGPAESAVLGTPLGWGGWQWTAVAVSCAHSLAASVLVREVVHRELALAGGPAADPPRRSLIGAFIGLTLLAAAAAACAALRIAPSGPAPSGATGALGAVLLTVAWVALCTVAPALRWRWLIAAALTCGVAVTTLTLAAPALVSTLGGTPAPTYEFDVRWFVVTSLRHSIATLALAFTFRASMLLLNLFLRRQQLGSLRADLAVAEERLRFSRDLHDVFGRTLTAVAVTSDLAAELADRGRSAEAAEQMRAVHRIAQDASTEVRALVTGYRAADLGTELAGARALLTSAGVTTNVTTAGETASLCAEQAASWVVCEAVTNVVRHADARWCTIAVVRNPEALAVTITNDGAPEVTRDGEVSADSPGAPAGVAAGSGLDGLRARLRPLGGTLDVEHAGGIFRLHARIPSAPVQEVTP